MKRDKRGYVFVKCERNLLSAKWKTITYITRFSFFFFFFSPPISSLLLNVTKPYTQVLKSYSSPVTLRLALVFTSR